MEKHLLLTVQFDEFSEVEKPAMLSILATHVTWKHYQRICFLPHLTGTDTDTGIKSITNSRLLPTPLLLEPLTSGDEFILFENQLNYHFER